MHNPSQEQENEYQNSQQHRAFLKEHQAIKNDFYYQYHMRPDNKTLWYLDGSYRPHEILSGDTYSIRSLDANSCFFFIIDAMGKGVSASVTSIVASSFINHLIDTVKTDFNLPTFIKTFNEFMIKNLLDEEVLAVLFVKIDFSKERLDVSSYAMPPILLYESEHSITKIKANNQPISKHNSEFNVASYSIQDCTKMLFCSDGLIESRLDNGDLYFSSLKQDFQNSKSCSSFLKKVYEKINSPDDDITLLFFKKYDLREKKGVTLTCSARLAEVEEVIEGFHEYLKQHGVDHIHTAKLGMVFSEMIMNAYEHGSLGISNLEKKELISKGKLNAEFEKREALHSHKNIYINYLITPHGRGKDLRFDIGDEGNGFDTEIFKQLLFDHSSVNGRGFKIAKKIVDAIYYSKKGDHVIIHKYIPKEL